VLFGGASLLDTWEWDGTDWARVDLVANPPPRTDQAMVFDPLRRCVVSFGGAQGAGLSAATWEWNGADWTQPTPPAAAPARAGHAMVFDGNRGEVLLFGGAADSAFADTWSWNGTRCCSSRLRSALRREPATRWPTTRADSASCCAVAPARTRSDERHLEWTA